MSQTVIHSIYPCPVYTIPLEQATIGANGLDASMKAVSLESVSTVATKPFSCTVNLQEWSPISSQPSSPDSSTDLEEPRQLMHTCSSLIPSLLIENPEQPIMLRTRSEAYQQKYLRYMNKIAGIDRVDHLSKVSLACLESYLSPCYHHNGIHFIKAYQKRMREGQIRRAHFAGGLLLSQVKKAKAPKTSDQIELVTPNLPQTLLIGNDKSSSLQAGKDVQIQLTEHKSHQLLSRHLVSSMRSTQASERMCLDA
ncbi:hypothetical protein CROQUDRAFT_674044 [Cronartium quercuum f. sp. fusiforme G11]|uniref:Uncharacterized protein n=1 Tax=Cronartium quercuum f. sp. fusiforme G11 TaxID=708437 RepID=A0A9P6N914_9BASI|nr:hypothetical protein CROQUDRAFT_674044 [Cronartium quercuum f. sp. fusiforme G11]